LKLLLDTHIWIWSILEPHRLTREVTKELTNSENQLWLSPISLWEAGLLHRKGRIKVPGEFSAWVATTMNKIPVSEAPLTLDVAFAVFSVKLPHDDPADQFLVASAKVFGLTLVTSDRHLLKADGISVLAN